jgi:hypothetical protein
VALQTICPLAVQQQTTDGASASINLPMACRCFVFFFIFEKILSSHLQTADHRHDTSPLSLPLGIK